MARPRRPPRARLARSRGARSALGLLALALTACEADPRESSPGRADAGHERHRDAPDARADAGASWNTWLLQFGSKGSDAFRAAAFDGASSVFVCGVTYGALPGFTNAGAGDIIVAKLDGATGSVVWQQQFGTEFDDVATALAVDSNGDLYLAGTTDGALGEVEAEQTDAFVMKVTGKGQRSWVTQLQTDAYDAAVALVVTEEDVVVLGVTEGALVDGAAGNGDYFLARLRGDSGAPVWSVQYGTELRDAPADLVLTGTGHLLVTGATEGALGNERPLGLGDAFLSWHSSGDGAQTAARRFGTDAFDMGHSLAIDDDGNVFVAGETEGALEGPNRGATDGFLTKLDAAGEVLWSRQFGTETWDFALDVAVADRGVITSGDTYGPLSPGVVKGRDVFFESFASLDGERGGGRQFGTVAHDFSHDLVIGPSGDAIVVGSTPTGLPGTSGLGSFDGFAVAIPLPW